jgi:TRAP-type mannitol/chloroaromatic compound transport system permease large subunit
LLDVGHIAGGLKGGMAIGIVLFGVLMGATTQWSATTIITRWAC